MTHQLVSELNCRRQFGTRCAVNFAKKTADRTRRWPFREGDASSKGVWCCSADRVTFGVRFPFVFWLSRAAPVLRERLCEVDLVTQFGNGSTPLAGPERPLAGDHTRRNAESIRERADAAYGRRRGECGLVRRRN